MPQLHRIALGVVAFFLLCLSVIVPADSAMATGPVSAASTPTLSVSLLARKSALGSQIRSAHSDLRAVARDMPLLSRDSQVALQAQHIASVRRVRLLTKQVAQVTSARAIRVLTPRVASAATTVALLRGRVHQLAYPTPVEPMPGSEPMPAVEPVPLVDPVPAAASTALGYNGNGTLPTISSLGMLRLWDTHTTWCDVQPTADITGAALDRRIAQYYAPLLDNAKANGIRRVIVVVGHPAPWVYGQDPASAPTVSSGMWYCNAPQGGFFTSANMLPSIESFTSNSPTSAGRAFTTYSQALMRFIATKYAGDFTTDFQSMNELNCSLRFDAARANTAATGEEAGQVLALHDLALRQLIDTEFPSSGFSVMSSSLASGSYATGGIYRGSATGEKSRFVQDYLRALDTSPTPIVNSLGFNSYSSGAVLAQPGALTTAQLEALSANWRDTARGLIDAVAGRVTPTRAPIGATAGFPNRLSRLPIAQTETNQNLINNPADCGVGMAPACNLTNLYLTDADRVALAESMVREGRALNLSAQLMYRWAPDPTQVAVQVATGSVSLTSLEAFTR